MPFKEKANKKIVVNKKTTVTLDWNMYEFNESGGSDAFMSRRSTTSFLGSAFGSATFYGLSSSSSLSSSSLFFRGSTPWKSF